LDVYAIRLDDVMFYIAQGGLQVRRRIMPSP
jgi:hypothetical protein